MSESVKTKKNKRPSFGSRLAQIRKAKGLTQAELGAKIGVSQRIMNHYENKAEYPPAPKIIELAGALEMSIDELLGLGDNGKKAYENINPKLAKKLRSASNLPPHDLKVLSSFIDALLLRQQVKEKGMGREVH
jgi:transcriptional regulator with XRE-family HTH domain